MVNLKVRSPVAAQVRSKYRLAERPASLAGKTVGLFWNMKRQGDVALGRLAELIGNRYEGVKYLWYSNTQPAPAELVQKAIKECDVVIGTSGD